MGFLDRFRRKIAAQGHPTTAASITPAPMATRRWSGASVWVPHGTTVQIGRYSVQDGMIYVGQVPEQLWGTDQMPESIDPL
ncbi:hypothetical protein FXN61_16740 [Lentzea sp. PSKA42]|uniref:Uncharacterized protein n=1 Tax=Lentzea indica TaxID=2604800 RepID=A0ABX1FHK8_9PSEU|nr:hypothetical protein [Lentzea indica]NKE58382.1 hypothetical protein [Lentzea indica]